MSRSVTDRRSLWLVLSEFYLDVELNSTDYERIAQRITELGYDIKEARSVDYYEVAPVIGSNLLSVAGVWSGFDELWLYERCQKNREARKGWFFRFKCHLQNLLLHDIRKRNWMHLILGMKKASDTI